MTGNRHRREISNDMNPTRATEKENKNSLDLPNSLLVLDVKVHRETLRKSRTKIEPKDSIDNSIRRIKEENCDLGKLI